MSSEDTLRSGPELSEGSQRPSGSAAGPLSLDFRGKWLGAGLGAREAHADRRSCERPCEQPRLVDSEKDPFFKKEERKREKWGWR